MREPCCKHCADDIIHAVEKDEHEVPCQSCGWETHDRFVAAKALREAADEVRHSIGTEPRLMHVVDWTEGMEYAERLLRDRADRMARGER